MDQDNKNTTGAPSNDTTSALFVSARKKQLEQQEADRRAREKEEQRLAAEAEVRKLEREVEERRRKTEEDARRAEAEAKRVAEESRAKMARAAENPDAVLGAPQQKKEIKLPQMPKISMPSTPKPAKNEGSGPPVGGEAVAKAPMNTKMLMIIGVAVAAVLLIAVLVMTMGGGGSKPVTASGKDFGGVWYLDYGDGDCDIYTFIENGEVTLDSYDGSTDSGTYKVSGESVEVSYGKYSERYQVDGNILIGETFNLTRELEDTEDTEGAYAGEQDDTPDGFITFHDPGTGLQLYYPEEMSAEQYLNSSDEEIVTIDSSDGMLCVMNFTEIYDDLVGTTNYDDLALLRALSNAFFGTHSEKIFGTEDWATALGTQDFSAALQAGVAQESAPESGRSFDTLAHFAVVLDIEGAQVNAYLALTRFHDSDLKVFNAIIWNTNSDVVDTLESVMKSMRISAQG